MNPHSLQLMARSVENGNLNCLLRGLAPRAGGPDSSRARRRARVVVPNSLRTSRCGRYYPSMVGMTALTAQRQK